MSADAVALKRAAGQAYGHLFRNLGPFSRRAAVPLLFLIPVQWLDFYRDGRAANDPLGLLFGLALLAVACHVSFMVSWHRFVLLGEGVAGTGVRFGRRELRFLLVSLVPPALAGLTVLPLGLLGFLALRSGVLTDQALRPLFLVAFVGLALWSYGRFLPAFPAVAIERPLSLPAAWRLTRGRQLLLLGLLVRAIVPAMALVAVMGALADEVPIIAALVLVALGTIVSVMGDAVVIATASLAYRMLVEGG